MTPLRVCKAADPSLPHWPFQGAWPLGTLPAFCEFLRSFLVGGGGGSRPHGPVVSSCVRWQWQCPPGQLAVNERCTQGPRQNFRHRTGPHYYSGEAFRQECSQKRSIHHDKMLPLLSSGNQSKQSNGDEPRVITYTRGSGVPLMESKSQSEANKPIHTDQSCLFSKALGTFPRNLV